MAEISLIDGSDPIPQIKESDLYNNFLKTALDLKIVREKRACKRGQVSV